MTIPPEDYAIDCTQNGVATLSGVLRLPSPAVYEEKFEPIHERLRAAETVYTVDISAVRFMNSSGITALSRLVLLARTENKALTLIGAEAVPWQQKTLLSLKRLYNKVDVQLR